MRRRFLSLVMLLSLLMPGAASAASLRSEFLALAQGSGLVPEKQAACIEDKGGTALLSQNADLRIIPASVSKLYTFDFALADMSPDFRYTTSFYLKGKTLYINGGGDPHFTVEHMRSVIERIYGEKKVLIDTFVFSPDFYYNWRSKPTEIRSSMVASLKEKSGAPIAKGFKVVAATAKYKDDGASYEFQSAPLSALLKQINDYSTNIAADVLFARLGGTEKFAKYMEETYGAGSDIVHLSTGSGLKGNYTTCNLTLRVIKHLHHRIEELGLELTDIMSVPTVDPGVLQKRVINHNDAKALVAKSGFVNFHHSLAGIINTKKGPMYFAVFTDFDTMSKSATTKSMIDVFISSTLQRYRKMLRSFDYTPDFTALKSIRISSL